MTSMHSYETIRAALELSATGANATEIGRRLGLPRRTVNGIIASAAEAMRNVRPGAILTQLRPQNCVEVSSYWKCWPCLFPQHGPGRKHGRPIVLSDWQRDLVDRWPDQLLRGLIHSDGCRFRNTGRNNWACPRYTFTNRSADIRGIFCHACDALGVRWTPSGQYVIYVSRKADVARLDEFIGPKQ